MHSPAPAPPPLLVLGTRTFCISDKHSATDPLPRWRFFKSEYHHFISSEALFPLAVYILVDCLLLPSCCSATLSSFMREETRDKTGQISNEFPQILYWLFWLSNSIWMLMSTFQNSLAIVCDVLKFLTMVIRRHSPLWLETESLFSLRVYRMISRVCIDGYSSYWARILDGPIASTWEEEPVIET